MSAMTVKEAAEEIRRVLGINNGDKWQALRRQYKRHRTEKDSTKTVEQVLKEFRNAVLEDAK